MDIKKRHAMRKSDIKQMVEELQAMVTNNIEELFNEGVEVIVTDSGNLYAINKEIIAFEYHKKIIPSLRALNSNRLSLPSITVDMGAIPFVTNGADVMVPGITKVSEGLEKGSVIVIIDEKFGKALAVGELMYSTNEIKEMKKGKVIKNIHYVDDEIWNLEL